MDKKARKGRNGKKRAGKVRDIRRDEKERILIVDDDEGTCRSLSLIFDKKGYDTETAETGQEALEKAQEGVFDLALLDIRLPDMEGVDLLAPLKEMHPDMPLVMITAYASTETAVRALNGQASAYITKPLDMDEVLAVIGEALEKQRLVREKQQAEEALRESEERYHRLFEKAPASITVVDVSGCVVDCNPATEVLTGYSREEIVGKSFEELLTLDPKDLPTLRKKHEMHLQGQEIVEPYELEILRKGGERRWIVIRSALLAKDGLITGFQIFATDITERKRMERALRESSEKLRIVFESVADAITITDISGKILDLNEAAVNTFRPGSREEAIGQDGFGYIAEKSRARCTADMSRLFEEGETHITKEYTMVTADGTEFEAESSNALLRDALGNPMGFVSINRDITERVQAEEALRESEESLKRTQQMAHVGGWEWDLTAGSFQFSEEMYRIYGQPSTRQFDDVWSMISETVHPDDRERVLDEARRITEEPRAFLNYRVLRPNGDVRWIEAPAPEVKRRAADGSPEVVVGAILDITERKQAEEAFRESEEKLRIMFESVEDAIAVTDISGKIADLNRAAVNLFGFESREGTIGQDAFKFIAESSRAKTMEDMSKLLEGKNVGLVEYTFVTMDGTEFEAESSNALLRDALGNPVGFVSVNRDITERKRTQEELVMKDRAMQASINAIDIVDLQGVNWDMQYVNRAFLDMWGFENEQEVLNRSARDFWVDADKLTGIVDALDEEGSWTGELTALRKDGSTFDAQVSAGVVRDEEGAPVCLVGSFVDVTERRKGEEALRESEEKYRNVVERANDAIIIIQDGLIKYFNPSAEAMFDVTFDEVVDTPFAPYIESEDLPMMLDRYTRRMAGGDVPSIYEVSVRHRDSSQMNIEINAGLTTYEGRPADLVVIRNVTERKQAEEALRQSEATNRALLEAIPDAIFRLDRRGMYVGFIPAKGFQTIIPPSEFLGKSQEEVLPPELAGQSSYYLEQALETGETQFYEYPLTFGEEGRYFESRLVKTGEEEVLGIVRDITERKRAEEELRDSEGKYRATVEQSADSIFLVDLEARRILESNAALQRLLGYSGEELKEIMLDDFVAHPREDIDQKIEMVLAKGSVFLGERIYRRKDGSTVDVEVSASCISYKGKEVLSIVSRDVTERKRADQELRESADRMRSLFENSPDIIMEIDRDGKLLFINFTVPGFTKEEVIGTPALDYLAPAGRDAYADAVTRVFETGEPLRIETRGAGPEGRLSWYETRFGPVTRDGEVASAMLIATDVTERREVEEQLDLYREHLEELVNERTVELEERTTQLEARSMELQEANVRLQEADRLKSIFLASMSHELRTPLNSIIGFTGIILQGMVGDLNEEQRRQLTMVKNAASHLLELINDLLDVSRVEAGKVDLWLEEFSLDDVVREVVETCLPMVNEKGLDFRMEVPEDIILFTDRRRMKQILMNFTSNAVKFSDRGSVKIAARVLDGEKLEMQVTDTGIGIEKGNMDKLFKPFQQIDVSLPKRYEGSGLGLYLSKKLADLLGGDIRAESEYGVGSEFTFVLPLKYGGGRRDEEEDIGG